MDSDKRVIFVHKKMEEFLLVYVGGTNDKSTRQRIEQLCSHWLQTKVGSGMITSYTFKMNDTNNTQYVVDAGKWVINITLSFSDRGDADVVVVYDPNNVGTQTNPTKAFDKAMKGI